MLFPFAVCIASAVLMLFSFAVCIASAVLMLFPFAVCIGSDVSVWFPFAVCIASDVSIWFPFAVCIASDVSILFQFAVCIASDVSILFPFAVCVASDVSIWFRLQFVLPVMYQSCFCLQYIKAGDLKKRLWKWSYTGGKQLARKNRSVGKYDDKSKSAILTYGALTVKYTNIDPNSTVRSEGNQLTIDCESGEVKANDYFPDAVCGKT